MKILRGLAACAVAVALTACTNNPNLLQQNEASTPPTVANQILIVVDDSVFGTPLFGPEGHAYLSGVGTGLQNALAGVPTSVVEVDSMMLTNPVPPALQATRPSHTIRVFTVSNTQRDGLPISAIWQMDVSSVAITAVPATAANPAGTRFRTTPIYKARMKSSTCLESESHAKKCGVAMGKFLGETLRAAHVMQFNSGS